MTRPNSKRKLRLERLENREMFARDEITFAGVGSLTFSIAPDGTRVGQEISSLQSEFNTVATPEVWQQAIARAFQKWSVQSNINIGNVFDNGAASGVYGPTRGDERFGDIRITGFEFPTDSYAEAVSENSRSVGTWAGDVFFNTAGSWKSVDAIEAAALHEVGHILGLGHSDDPASPMHTHGPSGALELTPQDIQNVQAIHGARKPDPNEGSGGNAGNETIAKATPIKGSVDDPTVVDGFGGTQVWIQFGDLLNTSDRDVYEFKTSPTYTGPLSVEVRSAGLSLARMTAEITDRNGNILVQKNISNQFGGVANLTLDQTNADTKYYLHVHSGPDAFWTSGDYSITIATPTKLLAESETIAEWARKAHRWYYDSDRTRDGFSYQLLGNRHDGPESNDNHTDDTVGSSVSMPLVLSTATRTVSRVVGTVSDLVDIDYYRFSAPRVLNGQTELVIDLESLRVGGLVPEIKLLDRHGASLKTEVRVQGFGQTQLVLNGVLPEQDFVVELKAGTVSDEFKTGNFTLTATFAEPSISPDLLAAGKLVAGTDSVEREWYVARPQLFGFSLSGQIASATAQGQIWVSIFNEERKLVTGLVAPLNSLRSTPGIFLNPGTYYFQIAAALDGGAHEQVAFRFTADQPSQPIGPLLGGTGVQPVFLCPGSTTQYCYPNSPTPTVSTQQVGPPPAVVLPAPAKQSVPQDPNAWFWSNNFLPTNPTNALDANGDGLVSPLDVLVIVNAINSFGFGPVPTPPKFVGQVDTNANGVLDPLDALYVINFINGRPNGPTNNV